MSSYEPTHGSPFDNSGSYCDSIAWDLAYDLRLNVGQPYPDGDLIVHVSSGGTAVKRAATADQIDKFARMLSDLAGRQRAREAAWR